MKLSDLAQQLQTHTDTDEVFQLAIKKELQDIRQVLFGNVERREKGMKEKQDEMYEILIGFKGLKWFGGIILFAGAVMAVLKGWLT